MKIFLDDVRFPVGLGSGWSIVRNATDFQYLWEKNKGNITDISFDHDLGSETTGYDCLKWVEEDIILGNVKRWINLSVHSMNPVGREKMIKVIKNLEERVMYNYV